MRLASVTAATAITVMTFFVRPAVANSSWDGLWYLDSGASTYAPHSFSLQHRDDGSWRYDDGSSIYVFRPNGKPWPQALAPGFTVIATLTSNVLDITERGYGRDMERWRRVLSSDGRRITGTDTRFYPDGHEAVSPLHTIRVGQGTGFAGRWTEPAEPQVSTNPAAAGPTAVAVQRQPHFVISTASDGTMMWYLPATGELIRGRADGRGRPLLGPQQPLQRTFAWQWLGRRKLLFTCRDRGKLIETAVETLSADGRSFTDTLWSAGYPREQDHRVFIKR